MLSIVKNNLNYFILILLGTLILQACDKIDDPIPNNIVSTDNINWDDSLFVKTNPTIRNVVIEEFTGYLCTFCPDGSREIDRLDSIHGDQLIPISIHAGGFAVPQNFDASVPPDGVLDFTEDYRTTEGENYFTSFGVNNNPAATVSRTNNANITSLGQWEPDILSILNDMPKVSIGLSVQYDDSSRTTKAIVNTEWLSSETGNFNLQISLVEDSVIDWQLDNGTFIENYIHRHVFRKAFNGTWGTPIPSSNIGDSHEFESAILLSSNWNKENCIVIAHVYKVGPDYEIMQAEELHIVDHP